MAFMPAREASTWLRPGPSAVAQIFSRDSCQNDTRQALYGVFLTTVLGHGTRSPSSADSVTKRAAGALLTAAKECVKPVGRMTWEALFIPRLGQYRLLRAARAHAAFLLERPCAALSRSPPPITGDLPVRYVRRRHHGCSPGGLI